MVAINLLYSVDRSRRVRCKRAAMNNSAEHNVYWSTKLFALLQAMAAQNTNAVLQVLASVDFLETERRYPESGLLFANNRWRAYYHCHEATSMHINEHGHFHLFTDICNQGWAHVAGLSINTEGQPLQWFTVNRWVTDGPWLDRDLFFSQLKYITTVAEQEGQVENWLAILLQLFRGTLFDLLKKRDELIKHNLNGRSKVEALDDNNVYLLSTQIIDLQSTLEKNLLNNPAPIAIKEEARLEY